KYSHYFFFELLTKPVMPLIIAPISLNGSVISQITSFIMYGSIGANRIMNNTIKTSIIIMLIISVKLLPPKDDQSSSSVLLLSGAYPYAKDCLLSTTPRL